MEVAIKIARVLGVTIEDLVDNVFPEEDIETMAMIRIIRSLTGRKKKLALGCLKLLDKA